MGCCDGCSQGVGGGVEGRRVGCFVWVRCSGAAAAGGAGIGLSTLERYLADHDVVVMGEKRQRRRGSLTDVQREEIRVGIELGESDIQIKVFGSGVTASTVWREIGCERRPSAGIGGRSAPITGRR